MTTTPATRDDASPLEGLPASMDVDQATAEQWAHIPLRAQHVLALLKAGVSQADIARGYRVTPEAIKYYADKYDPNGLLRLSPTARKALLASRFDAIAHAAISHVTPDKLEQASAPALLTVAGIATDKGLRLRESIAQDQAREDVGALAMALRSHLSPPADETPQLVDGQDDSQ